MNKYCIHFFHNNQEIELYEYLDNNLVNSTRLGFLDIDTVIKSNSQVLLFLPSDQIRTLIFEKQKNESHEQFKARFFSDYDESIISNISENSFHFNSEMSLVLIANKDILDPINQKLNQLGCSVMIIPEHYLQYLSESESILEINDRLVFAFEDGTGFSSDYSNIEQYLSILNQDRKEYKPIFLNILNQVKIKRILSKIAIKTIPMETLHNKILKEEGSRIPNLYHYEFSFLSLIKKLNISRLEIGFLSILTILVLILPNLNMYLMNSYEEQYKAATLGMFQSINPNTRRVINPKLQMDQLIIDSGIQITNRTININALKFIDRIDLELIETININFETSTIELSFKDITSIKYTTFLTIIESMELQIIDQNIVNIDGNINGVIKLMYSNQ
ncbi:hypothetical protein OAK03_02720 [Gammaproteobacteria bacterium]|nr:hypothetical protein [Gammaproteobacteria bacterium]